MDLALRAALRPLSSHPRLGLLEQRLAALGVGDVRVFGDLIKESPMEIISEILGLEDPFTGPEEELIHKVRR